MPFTKGECSSPNDEETDALCKVQPDYRMLPYDFYKEAVKSLIICCVDVIVQRPDGRILLFYRRDNPAKDIWWWPGGRM